MAEAKFHGVDLGWMQAQWRDCLDKGGQLKIFRDMTGAKNPEILMALGEDPKAEFPPMKHAGTWSAEEDRFLLRAVSEGKSDREIAREMGRGEKAVAVRLTSLRRRGIEVPQRWEAKRKAAEEKAVSGEVCPADDPGGNPCEICETATDAVYPALPEVDGELTTEERVCEPARDVPSEAGGVQKFGIAGFAVFKQSIGELTEERKRCIERLTDIEMKLSEAKAGMLELIAAIGSTPFDGEDPHDG